MANKFIRQQGKKDTKPFVFFVGKKQQLGLEYSMDLITETFINFKHKVMARVTEGVMFTYFVGACLIQHKNPTTPFLYEATGSPKCYENCL